MAGITIQAMAAPSVAPGHPGPAPLPRELTAFLVQFAAALGKSRAYPPRHPINRAAVASVAQHLAGVQATRPVLVLGIARDHLIVDGHDSEAGHPVLRDLAERLHHHQLAALQLRKGIAPEEIADLVGALGAETWRQGKPLALEPADALAARWPHAVLEALPLDLLEIGDDSASAGDRQSERVWQGLVHAVLMTTPDPGGGEAPPVLTPREVADAIRARGNDAGLSRQVVDWLIEAGEAATPGARPGAGEAVAQLVTDLGTEGLARLLRLGADQDRRRKLVFRAARGLPVKAALDLLAAAAGAGEHPAPPAFLRLMEKLAGFADPVRGPTVPGADTVLRDSMRQLVAEWGPGDPFGREHREVLDLLAVPAPSGHPAAASPGGAGALRVTQLALEIGATSPEVEKAALRLAESVPLADLLALADRGMAAGLGVDLLWRALAHADSLGASLADESADEAVLGQGLDRLGPGGLEPMLDALERADSASRRRWLISRLQRLGGGVAPRVAERLPGKPWFVQRNLLSLLGAIGVPQDFDPDPYARHADPRVRREACKLLFGLEGRRTPALLRAVLDPEPSIARLALAAAGDDCPPDLPARLLEQLQGAYRDPELRVAAIRLLGRRPTPAIRDWLVEQVVAEAGFLWFRRRRLREGSPDLVAAVGVLASAFARDPRAGDALRLARGSRDPEVRAAAGGGDGR